MKPPDARTRAAHDLNNLLMAIGARAEAALATPRLAEAARAELDEIRRRAREGGALVRALLGEARGEARGETSGEARGEAVRAVALGPFLAEGAEEIRRLLGPDRRLMLTIGRRPLIAGVAPDSLRRALRDIVVNARDAMGPGGTLRLRLWAGHFAEARAATPDVIPAGHWVVIEARDNGAGIPPALMDRVFEPFFTTKDTAHGSGIGLDSVRAALRAMGGWVSIDNAPRRGTEVCLYLPAIPRPAGTVLLVEDDAEQREAAARVLRGHGWRVRAVGSAEAALDAIEGMVPDLLITDLALPGMDGVALLATSRARFPGLPAVLVSGYDPGALPADALYLAKPHALKDLAGLALQAYAENKLRTAG